MLQLSQSELYLKRAAMLGQRLQEAMGSLAQNTGVIMPQNIESTLLDLKKYAKTKSAASPVLLSAIDLYEKYSGRIQLFDLSLTKPVPAFIPFIPGMRVAPNSNIPYKCVYFNTFRLGEWSSDRNDYLNLIPITDLQACLESGFIAHQMIIENKAQQILDNPVVLENLTRIYTKMFYNALIKVAGNLPLLDFNKECAMFLIAKFFLVYIVQKSETDPSVNTLARIAGNCTSSLSSLISYSENLNIDFTRLSGFLATFGTMFFDGHPTSLIDFERSFIQIYGEGLLLAIEYIPYLLHFLFAPIHASRLGGVSRLDKHMPNLQRDGLIKLYNAVMKEVLK